MWAGEPQWPWDRGLQPLTSPLPPATGLLRVSHGGRQSQPAKDGILGGPYDSLTLPWLPHTLLTICGVCSPAPAQHLEGSTSF